MSVFIRVIQLGTVATLLMGTVACEHRDHRYDDRYDNGYRYENGDRVDRYGHRDPHWCANHPEDTRCHP